MNTENLNKDQVIELLCLAIIDNDSNSEVSSYLNSTLQDFRLGLITKEVAVDRCKNPKLDYWRSKYTGKEIGRQLRKLSEGLITKSQVLILVSSIITRCYIEISHKTELSIEQLGIPNFIDYLTQQNTTQDYDNDFSILIKLIDKFGFRID